MRICPNCGYSTEGKDNFCPYCGNPLMDATSNSSEQSIQTCKTCGRTFNEDMDFCPYCGTKVEKESPKQEEDFFESYYSDNKTTGSSEASAHYTVCPKCGKSYNSSLSSCPNCSAPRDQKTKDGTTSKSGEMFFGIIAIIFSFFGGIIGFILSIIGIKKFKSGIGKTLCIIGLVLSIFWTITWIILNVESGIFFDFYD